MNADGNSAAVTKGLLAIMGRVVVGGLTGAALGLLVWVIWAFLPLPSPNWWLTASALVFMVVVPATLWAQAAAIGGLGQMVVDRARDHRLVRTVIEAVITRLSAPFAGVTEGLRTLPLERLETVLHAVVDERLAGLDKGRTRWLVRRLRTMLVPRLQAVLLARWRAPEGGIDVARLQATATDALENAVLDHVRATVARQARLLRIVGLVLVPCLPLLLALFKSQSV